MQHIMTSPMPMHRRRPAVAAAAQPDARWHILDLVRTCRDRLTLRDRDIAVLRGLVSLLPVGASGSQLVVFASNRVLAERCDGMDERTLRRRIAHLTSCGLLARRQSPNGKRYQVRDESDVLLSYGIDLRPLFGIAAHLEALADDIAREAVRAKALKALIRDALYHAPAMGPQEETARLALRRKLSVQELEAILSAIRPGNEASTVARDNPGTTEQTASDSQNDRHIHISDKDSFDLNGREEANAQDITVDQCMDMAGTALTLASSRPRTWREVVGLANSLAPAIGLKPHVHALAQERLGHHGCALAVLGLVEAVGRIRNAEAYLSRLMHQASDGKLDVVRMFRSLVKPGQGRAAWC